MSKGLQTLITILCVVCFGVFGFAAYKVYDTGFSRSDKHASTVPESSVSETSVSGQSGTIAFDPTPATPWKQDSSEILTSAYGAKYTIDKEFFQIYSNESGKWVQASFRITNKGNYPFDLYTAFWYATDAYGNTTALIGGSAASPFLLDPGKSAWYCIYADKNDDDLEDSDQIIYQLNSEPAYGNRRGIVYYSIYNLRLEEENGLPVAYGTIENNSNVDTSTKERTFHPWISVFLFDKNGNVIGELGWATLNFAPGAKEDFKAELVIFQRDPEKTPSFDFTSIADYEAIAYEIYEES